MKKMRLALIFVALAAISAKSFAAMSLSEIRREARFLTDRMGHELGLSTRQFEDVYEINFDFLYQANEVIDDVVYGYDDAIDYYYYLLDVRNEDLMYVLRNNQYRKFINRDYFYRPIYMVGRTWGMRIWSHYSDRNYFYFSVPVSFNTYIGDHYRIHFAMSYYADRYTHKLFQGAFRLWGGGYQHHKHDGWMNVGMKKHTYPDSRPWSNAKNYEKSRRDLKEGFVNVPSRDANKRKVKVSSEENRRTAVTSDIPTRTGESRRNTSSDVSTRKDNAANAVRSKENSNSSSRSAGDNNSTKSDKSSVTRTSASNGSSNVTRNANTTGSTTSRSSNSSSSSVSRSSANRSSSDANRSSNSVTRNANSANKNVSTSTGSNSNVSRKANSSNKTSSASSATRSSSSTRSSATGSSNSTNRSNNNSSSRSR